MSKVKILENEIEMRNAPPPPSFFDDDKMYQRPVSPIRTYEPQPSLPGWVQILTLMIE